MNATFENLTPGTHVKCVYPHIESRRGRTATIVSVAKNYCHTSGYRITVAWDDGDTNYPRWSEAKSFEIIGEANALPKAVSEHELYHGGITLQE